MQFSKDYIVNQAKGLAEGYLDSIRKDMESAVSGTDRDFGIYQMPDLKLFFKTFLSTAQGESSPKAEETVSRILRMNLPGTAVDATVNHITLSLPNGKYCIYRETSAFRSGSCRILDPWSGKPVETTLTSRELADFLVAFDQAIPELIRTVDEMEKGVTSIMMKLQALLKAREIEEKTVHRLLEGYLVPVGIDCVYEIVDGKVRISLTRKYTGEAEVPIEGLAAFLADKERVESTLSAPPAGSISRSRVRTKPWPRKFYSMPLLQENQ